MRRAIALMLAMLVAWPALAQAPLGADLQGFAYPYPVHWFEARAQGGMVRMAYLDVAPTGPDKGETLVLLHGKNFCAATWGETAAALARAGYRVIAPDQVGFCKSSKPAGFQYSFAALATLTRDLLAHAGVGRFTIVGHSTGGMLAVHYQLLYPQARALVLVDPLGLNDTLAEGVPYAPLDTLRSEEAKTDRASIKAYQLRNYYHGDWRPEYDRWVDMLAGECAGADGARVREAQARLSDMIETQPIAAALARIEAPVTLLIGQADTTAFRASTAPADRRAGVRTVPQAAETAVGQFPHGRLVRLDGLGHAPQIEAPARFQAALLAALAMPPA